MSRRCLLPDKLEVIADALRTRLESRPEIFYEILKFFESLPNLKGARAK
jgi:hypothetical protein